MSSVCFYFQVHQPRRIRPYRVFDIGESRDYFGDTSETDLNNERVLQKVARKSYLPTNRLLLDLLASHPEMKVSFSLSGTVIEQLQEYSPETLESFQALVDTGRVEILGETYYHSLAFFYSREEFIRQVNKHTRLVEDLFGYTPSVFRNTELAYNNEVARWAKRHGYKGVIAEGWDAILGWRSPNFVYEPSGVSGISLLLKNYKLSDDIAFRFSREDWEEWPLTAEKFAHWVSSHNGNGDIINLFMDYETFGEHQWEDTGIFDFLSALPEEVYKHPDNDFKTPSEVIYHYEPKDEVHVEETITWADTHRDLSAWLGNRMQQEAIRALYDLEEPVLQSGDRELIEDWRRLQTSDHFYYMCTKWSNDGDVHAYFSPYESPYDAFITYMNVLNDMRLRVGLGEKGLRTKI